MSTGNDLMMSPLVELEFTEEDWATYQDLCGRLSDDEKTLKLVQELMGSIRDLGYNGGYA